MKIGFGGAWIVSLYIFVLIFETFETSEWFNELASFIANENKENHVLLLFDKNRSEYPELEKVLQKIPRKFPVTEISSKEATKKKVQELSQLKWLYNPRSAIIIIIHFSKDPQRIASLIDFVRQISEPRRRPKCLIIIPQEQEKFAYLKLLKEMWSKRFLDVTILEIVKETIQKKNFFLELSKEVAFIHQLNPFTNVYNRMEYSSSISWFPKKDLDLNGHEINVALISMTPLVLFGRDENGNATNVTGQDILMIRSISKAMNFTLVWVIADERNQIGRASCRERV